MVIKRTPMFIVTQCSVLQVIKLIDNTHCKKKVVFENNGEYYCKNIQSQEKDEERRSKD